VSKWKRRIVNILNLRETIETAKPFCMLDEELDFLSKSIDLDGLKAIPDHELPSDRHIEMAKNRRVFRGQFGIGTILVFVSITALVCAVPVSFSWNQADYWFGIMMSAFLLAPMIGFLIGATSRFFGFSKSIQRYVAFISSVLATLPCVIFMALNFYWPMLHGVVEIVVTLLLFWLPQVAAICLSRWLFRQNYIKSIREKPDRIGVPTAAKNRDDDGPSEQIY